MIRAVMERFVDSSPAAVMARLVMQCALHVEWTEEGADADDDPDGGLTREALCREIVSAMGMIVQQQSPRARANVGGRAAQSFGPAIAKLHDGMSRLQPAWGRTLVRDSARLMPGAGSGAGRPVSAAAGGYQLRILAGNGRSLKCTPGPNGCIHEPAPDESGAVSRSRLRALPVYAPDTGLIVDLVPYERGQIHERAFIGSLLEAVGDNELWIVRGRFGADALLGGWPRVGSAFVLQEQGCAPTYQTLDDPGERGEFNGGRVYEQNVVLATGAAGSPTFRRIEWRAGEARGHAHPALGVLTNVPVSRLDAMAIIGLLHAQGETDAGLAMAPVFDGTLFSEVQPRAALLAAGILAVAHNVLVTMSNAVDRALGLDARDVARLHNQIASSVCETYPGMMIALPPECWSRYDRMSLMEVADVVQTLADRLDPRSRRRQKRGRGLPKAQDESQVPALDRLLYGNAEPLTMGTLPMRTIAMATREFSSNPSKALRHVSETLVTVTKYNRPIALLVSIEDWNRLLLEVRENGMSRSDDACFPPMPLIDIAPRRGSALN